MGGLIFDGPSQDCDHSIGVGLTDAERAACPHENLGPVLGKLMGGMVWFRQCLGCGLVMAIGRRS